MENQPPPPPQSSTIKLCADCHAAKPSAAFSGAQLKKKSKCKCKVCISKVPPSLTIRSSDLLTEKEIHCQMSRSLTQLERVAPNKAPLRSDFEIEMDQFTPICKIYPPSESFPWWRYGEEDAIRYADALVIGAMWRLWGVMEWAEAAYKAKPNANANKADLVTLSAGVEQPRQVSIFEDDSRIIHKMLVYCIYYMRHCWSLKEDARMCMDIESKYYGNIQSETNGPKCVMMYLAFVRMSLLNDGIVMKCVSL